MPLQGSTYEDFMIQIKQDRSAFCDLCGLEKKPSMMSKDYCSHKCLVGAKIKQIFDSFRAERDEHSRQEATLAWESIN